MAMRRLGSAHQEAKEVRSRLQLKSWDVASFDVLLRLSDLKKLIGSEKGNELHRHVIVSSVAALQTYHRGTIISIVDLDDKYKERAAEKVTEKISMKDALEWLSGRTVTFGELVAHGAPCNTVTDMLSWLSTLLNCDMKQAMADAIDPYDLRNGCDNPPRVVADVDQLLADLAETFRLRHIFAHEAAPSIIVDADKCRALHRSVVNWVDAVDAVLWATAYQHLPLTQSEMNQHAGADVQAARKRLAGVMRRALSDARAEGSAGWLRKNHFAWMNATMDWAHHTYRSLQGTMWPAVGASDLAKVIQTRADQVSSWNRIQNRSQNMEDPLED